MNNNTKSSYFKKWLKTIMYLGIAAITIPTLIYIVKGVFRIGSCPMVIESTACKPDEILWYAIQGIIFFGLPAFAILATLSGIISLAKWAYSKR